jgi:hypothetical protein
MQLDIFPTSFKSFSWGVYIYLSLKRQLNPLSGMLFFFGHAQWFKSKKQVILNLNNKIIKITETSLPEAEIAVRPFCSLMSEEINTDNVT